MNIVEYSSQGATVQLNQRELLLVMALVQEGRESFGCNSASGKALDDLFSMANALVEVARRSNQSRALMRHQADDVATLEPVGLDIATLEPVGLQVAANDELQDRMS